MQKKQTNSGSSKAAGPTTIASQPTRIEKSAPRRQTTEEEIRLLAYHKWVCAGQPEGDGLGFWLEAEQQLLAGK